MQPRATLTDSSAALFQRDILGPDTSYNNKKKSKRSRGLKLRDRELVRTHHTYICMCESAGGVNV